MRRTTTAVSATVALGAALTFGAAYATQGGSSTSPAPTDGSATSSPVTNKNGHEVNEHAAKGRPS